MKEAFQAAWTAYTTYAAGFDELRPLSLNGTNNRYGWGLTVVEALDTAIIMELTDTVQDMLQFIAKTDFTTTDFPGRFGVSVIGER